MLAFAILFVGCTSTRIPDVPIPSESSDHTTQPTPVVTDIPTISDGTLYGAYLTTYSGADPLPDFQAIRFTSYAQVEEYFNANENSFFFGARFTLACITFTDEFFQSNDIIMLVINETSTYASFALDGIVNNGNGTVFNINRYLPDDAPQSENVAYHIILTAPKGGFETIDTDNSRIHITDIQQDQDSIAFDVERYRYVYPEFWPFTYRTEPLEATTPLIDVIDTYDELLSFYEWQKTNYDLDMSFFNYIGPVYDQSFFDDYVLLIAILPFDSRLGKPNVNELYIYNLNVWMMIDNFRQEIPTQYTRWYILTAGVVKKYLEGINLKEFNIGN